MNNLINLLLNGTSINELVKFDVAEITSNMDYNEKQAAIFKNESAEASAKKDLITDMVSNGNLDLTQKLAIRFNGKREWYALEDQLVEMMGDDYWNWAESNEIN